MGIKGLWDHLPVTAREQSLMEFTIEHGFEANPQGLRAYRLGIDVSLWFYHARKAMGKTRNGELQMFFHRCCRLLKSPVLPLFVFDGPYRPTMKRNKPVKMFEDAQLNDIRQLITAFGFECLTKEKLGPVKAPGEAEAALAQLNAAGIIDAVLSDDADCFLFGAKTVLRSVKGNLTSKYLDTLNVYNIQTLEDSSFSREELLVVALLRGGDYDSGVTGCGITTAVNLRQLGFGKRLNQNWNQLQRSSLMSEWSAFRSVWREEIRDELLSNASGYSGQVNRRAADNITYAFPGYGVLAAYLMPETFDSYELKSFSKALWETKFDMSKLAAACLNKFPWSTSESKMFEAFEHLVWPGAVMRILLGIIKKMDEGKPVELPFEVLHTVGRKPKAQINCVSIRLSTTPFIQAIKDGLSKPHTVYDDTVISPYRIPVEEEPQPTIDLASNDNLQDFWIHGSIITAICSQDEN